MSELNDAPAATTASRTRALWLIVFAWAVLAWFGAAALGRMGEFVVMAPALAAMVAGVVIHASARFAAAPTARRIAAAIALLGAAVFLFCVYLVLFVHPTPV